MYTGTALSMNIVDSFLKTAIALGKIADEEEKRSFWRRLFGIPTSAARVADIYMRRWLYAVGRPTLLDRLADGVFGNPDANFAAWRLARQETTRRRANPTAERRPGPRVRPPFNPQPAAG